MRPYLAHALARCGLAAALALLGRVPAAAQEDSVARRPPNIVFILADDLGYGDLGAYGQRVIDTPRLDRMAREGMRFTQHYAGAPVCAPSRSALMTGLHTGHTTVRGNLGRTARGEERIPLRAEDVTVAEVLKGAGYATGIIGKWGLGEPGTAGVPNAQGFDYFFGYLNQRHAHSYYPDHLWRNGERVPLPGNLHGARREYSHDLFAREALSFLERNRDRPFFLYLALTLPHAALEVPDDAYGRYRSADGRSVFPETVPPAAGADRQPMARATYAAMVTRLDRDVGRVLDRLRELGLAENTLVVFTSDNGPHREGGHDPEFFDGNGPLRGIKRELYEGGIRVPMLAWWPGTVRAGSETDHVSAHWDFLPTAAALAGVPVPPGVDGISYRPLLRGESQPRHDLLYWEFYEGAPAQAVRMGRWKAVRRGIGTGAVELYDLAADPGETLDLAARHPDVVARARRVMDREHVPSPFWSSGR